MINKRCMTQDNIHHYSPINLKSQSSIRQNWNQKQNESQLKMQNGLILDSSALNKTLTQKGTLLKDQFDANITIINKQLSNIEVDRRQILYLPTYLNQKTTISKANNNRVVFSNLLPQRVIHFALIQISSSLSSLKPFSLSLSQVDLSKENKDLKEHIKFLLSQIKKIQKTNVNAAKEKLNESKGISDNITELKMQIEENRDVISKLKIDYNLLISENGTLKRKLEKKGIPIYSSYNDLQPVRDVQAFFVYSNENKKNNKDSKPIYNIKEEEDVNEAERVGDGDGDGDGDGQLDNINEEDTSIQFYNTPITNSNELFLMKLIKKDSTVLCFNKVKRTFSFTEYFDKGNTFKPYFNEDKAIYFTRHNYLYIIISKLAFLYDHTSHTISQLHSLNRDHSKGCLLLYDNNRLLCISGMESECVEEFHIDTEANLNTNSNNSQWSFLPSMSSPRAEASFLLLNHTTLFGFFGFNYKKNEYLSSIEYIDLSSSSSVNAMKWKCYTDLPITIRKHSVFASSKGILYLLGGKTDDDEYNSTSLQLTFKSALEQGFEIEKIQDNLPKYIYESNFYEYVDIATGDLTKISFDDENNIHLVNTESLHHTIITYV